MILILKKRLHRNYQDFKEIKQKKSPLAHVKTGIVRKMSRKINETQIAMFHAKIVY